MLYRTIEYRGYQVDIYRYEYTSGTKVFYYPSFNGNAEFTKWKDLCHYIRTVIWTDNALKQTLPTFY